ncbi:MAG: hypothetical protein ABJB05_01725 [Parafilimonas sp.]
MNKLFSYLLILCCVTVLFSCQKEISKETNAALSATGSLWDSTGNCFPDSVHGTFYGGITPGSDTAYVEMQVNVTQTGSYSITSDLQDGFQFADSGFFSSTGINTIHLKPLGTPIIPTTSVFNISFDSSFCTFTVVIQDSTGTGLGGQKDTTGTGGNNGSWQFSTDSSLSAAGTFYAVQLLTDTVVGGTDLQMAGFTPNTDSVLVLAVHFSGNTITPGTYYTQIVGTDPFSNAVFAFSLVSTGNPIYDALENPGDGSNMGITISAYDASTHIVTGTFSGTAIDEPYSPATIGITNGSFTATVSP